MLRTVLVGGDVRQVDLRLHHCGELDLSLFRGFNEPLQRLAVLAQIYPFVALELLGEMTDDPVVVVVAAKIRIAGRGLDFEHAVTDFKN